MNHGTNYSRLSFGFSLSIAVLSVFILSFHPAQIFAQEVQQNGNFTVITGNALKNNPTAIQILKNIEISKQRIAQMQNAEKQQTEHEKFIDEQRKLAQEILNKDLARMNRDNEDHTPTNAFNSFVTKINSDQQGLYWDQFNYVNEKIKLANQAKQAVLNNGGSYAEAQSAYIEYASMQRTEMVQVVSDLNVKYGFTDNAMESYFDEYGKLPRYEDDSSYVPICYGCDKYEQLRDQMLEQHELEKLSKRS